MEKKWWTILFLGITALAIFLELFAVYDGDPNTLPWTSYIATYIPVWVGLPLIVLLAIWLVIHFIIRYRTQSLVIENIIS